MLTMITVVVPTADHPSADAEESGEIAAPADDSNLRPFRPRAVGE